MKAKTQTKIHREKMQKWNEKRAEAERNGLEKFNRLRSLFHKPIIQAKPIKILILALAFILTSCHVTRSWNANTGYHTKAPCDGL